MTRTFAVVVGACVVLTPVAASSQSRFDGLMRGATQAAARQLIDRVGRAAAAAPAESPTGQTTPRRSAPVDRSHRPPVSGPGPAPAPVSPDTVVGADLTGPITAAYRATLDAMDMGELGRLCDRRNGTTPDVPRSSWTVEQHRGRYVCQGPKFGEGG